jgi:hypothetical protein
MNEDHFKKGMEMAQRIALREAREKERHEDRKRKHRDEERKQAAAARARTLTALEWYILGIVSFPFVGPLYNMAIQHVTQMAVH